MESVLHKINNLDNDYILNASRAELENYFISKVWFEELILDVDGKYLDNKRSVQVTAYDYFDKRPFKVPGTSVDLCIPFKGDKELFELRPSTFNLSGYPDINIQDDLLIIPISYQDSNAEGNQIKKTIESDLKRIIDAITNVNKDTRAHNNNVESSIKATLDSKINKAKKSLDVLDILDIPLRRKDNPDTYVLDVRRKVKTTKSYNAPKTARQKYVVEPSLDNDEYNHILEVLRSMSKVIERSPKSFMDLDEEAIRMHFLLQLNGHYEGNASGETFNKSGKTDILIRVEDKNIFIGECKFWKGPKSFKNAIDQLLRYLVWRDTKCALLIFNRNKNSSDVATKMHEIMQNRVECKRIIEFNPEGDSKYIFVKESDPGREILITTQLYDLPRL
ncbi:hypothetical protein [Wukongibacter sp. M2B1]|uniref:hypothetical protein n=1 Tax=Wukongibacter sp. M2B1 TaxID=3088895 RepID=UPI003D7B4397